MALKWEDPKMMKIIASRAALPDWAKGVPRV
jgi:hypothetical protein